MTKVYGPQIYYDAYLNSPHGPKVWTDSYDREDIIHELFPQYAIISITFDFGRYLYRLHDKRLCFKSKVEDQT